MYYQLFTLPILNISSSSRKNEQKHLVIMQVDHVIIQIYIKLKLKKCGFTF